MYAYGDGSSILIQSSSLAGNAAEQGGAAFVGGGKSANATAVLQVRDSSFVGNAARGRGGAVMAQNASLFQLERSSFLMNGAERGGAVAAGATRTVVVESVTAVANVADLTGGVFQFSNLTFVTVNGSSFSDNSAAAGGLLFVQGAAAVPPCLQPNASSLPASGAAAQQCFLSNNTASRCAVEQ